MTSVVGLVGLSEESTDVAQMARRLHLHGSITHHTKHAAASGCCAYMLYAENLAHVSYINIWTA